jgi:hypothetical protein
VQRALSGSCRAPFIYVSVGGPYVREKLIDGRTADFATQQIIDPLLEDDG